jgi:tyrosinase
VFDTQLGFGGNGDTGLRKTPNPAGGYCVTDGPFAMLQVRYFGLKISPHCLSRNFRNDTKTGHFSGELLSSEIMDEIMQEEDLLKFTLKLEGAPHNAIPFGIGGDFKSFNAPAGKFTQLACDKELTNIPQYPLFFLHHFQLDRLLWKWQQIRPAERKTYNTKKSKDAELRTSLKDKLVMGDLGTEILVADVIDTEGGLLCYKYDE